MKRLIVALCLIAFIIPARSHFWYESACCSGNDCAPVPASDVEEIEPRVWRYIPTGHVFRDEQVRPSQDGDYHVCDNGRPLCLYIVQGS